MKVLALLCGVTCALALASCGGTRLRTPNAPAAQVERFELVRRASAFNGIGFEGAGQYEVLMGVAHVRVNPYHPANQAVVDLDRAVRSADGWVRYRSDVIVLRPSDPARASRVMVVDVASDGSKLFMRMANEGGGALEAKNAAGTGFTMRRGHTLVWIGWQGGVPQRADGRRPGIALPLATDGDAPLTGISTEEVVFDDAKAQGRLRLLYPAATLQGGRVTVRRDAYSEPVQVPSWRWMSHNEIEIDRPQGFDGGAIYAFSYHARDPMVMGLGLTALRDVTLFLKDQRAQANPVADIAPRVTLGVGVAQGARVLRDFIWQGFNTAPHGGRVFDGALPLGAGAGKSFTNHRFALPASSDQQHSGQETRATAFPFSYGVTTDPLTGRTDGIFARCAVDNSCPRLMHVDSSTEYWQGRASLVMTDGAGRDIALPAGVRAYLNASTQQVYSDEPALAGICRYRQNPAPQAPLVRALLDRLVAWTRDGIQPPASRYPTISALRLAEPTREATGFPDLALHDIGFPQTVNGLGVKGRDGALQRYAVLVPVADADGHEIAGVRLPDIDVPLATHAGWNLRRTGFAQGQLCGQAGFALPLPAVHQHGDPRVPLAQRYPRRLDYAKAVARSARALRDAGLLLQEDVDRYIERARSERRVEP